MCRPGLTIRNGRKVIATSRAALRTAFVSPSLTIRNGRKVIATRPSWTHPFWSLRPVSPSVTAERSLRLKCRGRLVLAQSFVSPSVTAERSLRQPLCGNLFRAGGVSPSVTAERSLQLASLAPTLAPSAASLTIRNGRKVIATAFDLDFSPSFLTSLTIRNGRKVIATSPALFKADVAPVLVSPSVTAERSLRLVWGTQSGDVELPSHHP